MYNGISQQLNGVNQMTRQEAENLGWKFKGDKRDTVAEKGSLIHMGQEKFVLEIIRMVEGLGLST